MNQRIKIGNMENAALLITGLVTQGCVRATCLGGLELGCLVILVSDAHSTYSKGAENIIQKWNARPLPKI